MKYRNIFLITVFLLAALGLAYWAGSRASGVGVVATFPEDGGETGASIPIEITFDRPMQEDSVSAGFRLEPEATGRWEWDGQTAWFIPQHALDAGILYTARLSAGVLDRHGQPIGREAVWKFRVRPAEVVYLSPVRGPRELWRASLDGKAPVQLTSTGGRVVDFSVSPGGNRIAVAVQNGEQGIDLRLVDRNGTDAGLLAGCGQDTCRSPAWSPAGRFVAYSRKSVDTDPRSQVWTAEVSTGRTALLYAAGSVAGQDPGWSPDGKRLVFYDPENSALRVLDLQDGSETRIQTEQDGTATWSPDGLLGYNDLQGTGVFPHTAALAYDFALREASVLIGKDDEAAEYGLPEWSPDGAWLAAGSHPAGGPPAQQLFLYRADGSPVGAITEDIRYSNGACQWDPWGRAVLFQRSLLGGSDVRPEVAVWDRTSGETRVLAQDAGQPAWLP